MLSGRYRSAWRRLSTFAVVPSIPVLNNEYRTRYGLASGATDRTSTRMDFELPIGTRTIEPRSVADAFNWLGASKCGSSRRYEFTLRSEERRVGKEGRSRWSP